MIRILTMKPCTLLLLVLVASCNNSKSQDEAATEPPPQGAVAGEKLAAEAPPAKPKPHLSKLVEVEPSTVWEVSTCKGLLTAEEVAKTCGEEIEGPSASTPSEHFSCNLRWEVPGRSSDEERQVSLLILAGTTETQAALAVASERAKWKRDDPNFERPEQDMVKLMETDRELYRNESIWGRSKPAPSDEKSWSGSSVTIRWRGVRAALSDFVRTNDKGGALCEDDELVILSEIVLGRIAKLGRRRPEAQE